MSQDTKIYFEKKGNIGRNIHGKERIMLKKNVGHLWEMGICTIIKYTVADGFLHVPENVGGYVYNGKSRDKKPV